VRLSAELPDHPSDGADFVTVNSKDPVKEQARRLVDEKQKTINELANASTLPPRLWVDEGWGYQVGQNEQSKSASTEFEPIEYEGFPAARQPKAEATVAAAPARPVARESGEGEESAMPPVPPTHWTLVEPE
jgi:hypothetical protein